VVGVCLIGESEWHGGVPVKRDFAPGMGPSPIQTPIAQYHPPPLGHLNLRLGEAPFHEEFCQVAACWSMLVTWGFGDMGGLRVANLELSCCSFQMIF